MKYIAHIIHNIRNMINKLDSTLKIQLQKKEQNYEVIISNSDDLDLIFKGFIMLLKDSGFSEQDINKALLLNK